MHTYSLFNILVIFEIAWDFSDCLSFSSSLFLFTLVVSITPKCKSTPAQNPLRSELSSSSDPTLPHIRFLDDDAFKAFLRHSFGTPSHFVGLCQHRPSLCHSQSGMGVTVWRPSHLSSRVYPGVLLQHAWDWLFSTSFLHSRSRYAHSYHTATCCGCASGP